MNGCAASGKCFDEKKTPAKMYIGSITNDYVVATRSPVAGLPLFHQR